MSAIGFDQCENPPSLGASYADAIIAQTELAIWALQHYPSDLPRRCTSIRRYRRWVNELREECERRRAVMA